MRYRAKVVLIALLIYTLPGIFLVMVYLPYYAYAPFHLVALITLTAVFAGPIMMYFAFWWWAIGCSIYYAVCYSILYIHYRSLKTMVSKDARD